MKYQEQQKYAELAYSEFCKGAAVANVRMLLANHNIAHYDFDKILRSAKSIMLDQYGARIAKLLSNGESIYNDESLRSIDVNYLKDLEKDVRSKLASKIKKQVQELLSDGAKEDEILSQINLDLFSSADVFEEVERFRLKDDEVKSNNRLSDIAGIIMIVVALYAIINGSARVTTIFLGVAGVYLLFKNFNKRV